MLLGAKQFFSAAAGPDVVEPKRLAWLESSGSQWIDTGVVPTSDTMVWVKYEYLVANSNYDMIAGCTQPRYYPVSLSSKNPLNERHVYNGTAFASAQTARTSHVVVFNDALHRVFKDGQLVTTFDEEFSSERSCFLFAGNDNGNKANWFSSARIYWCEFINSATGEVLRRFVPALDGEGRPAMFDEVGREFYYNQGTSDDLIAGPEEMAP